MRGERRLLRIGEYLIARACRHLPAEARDERYREWVAELPAILRDPGVRPAARRAARMLRYASGTIRGTALTPGSARRVMAHTAGAVAPFITTGLVFYLLGRVKTPQEWIGLGIGCLLGSLTISGCRLAYRAYRRKRGKGLGDDLTELFVPMSPRAGALPYGQSMRYGQRGGYTPAKQERRERLRLGAAERFARGDATAAIAADLRVTERTVRRWRQAWRDG
jgi:hypothetical protein